MTHPRGLLFLLLLAVSSVVAGASAHATTGVRVQRVITPDAAARLRARGLPVRAGVMTPDELAGVRARQRASHAFPHVLAAPGLDWSANASRRTGWSRPVRDPRSARLRHAEATDLGPPDTLRVAILRVDFLTDRGGSASSGDGHFDLTDDTTSPPIDRAPRNRQYFEKQAEALARYYDVQTYGRVVVQPDVWPRSQNGAYSATDMADFGPWSFGQGIYRAAVDMFRTMLFAADSQSIALGDRIPWDRYDRIVIIHAGSDLQSDVQQDSKEDIPSFTIGVSDTDVVIFPDSTTRAIDRASFVPETITQDLPRSFYGTINGVLAHECGHLFFGFFDVYDIEQGFSVVGQWSLMDSGNQVFAHVFLPDGTDVPVIGLLPPSIDPLQRGWATDAIQRWPLDWGVEDTLRSSERHPDIRRLDLSGDEYLLLENRYLSPADSVQLDQDSTTRVIMGPKAPDRFEYDALLDGGGVLVWHVDESVIPLEFAFPLDTALRVNPDYGINTNYSRLGLSVVEADGLNDLGDPSSIFYGLTSRFDPFYVGNNTVLSDSTAPSLIPHIGTRTHMRVDFLDTLSATMRVRASRDWALPGWPRKEPFPLGGAELLAVDTDGDLMPEIAWAGGTRDSSDSSDVFVMKLDGTNHLGQTPPRLAHLDRRPDPRMAAIAAPGVGAPGALFAVVTREAFPGDTAAGWLHVFDAAGLEHGGFPVKVGSNATPPVIAGSYPNAAVFVGQSDRRVHAYALTDGLPIMASDALPDDISGTLAVRIDAVGPDAPAPGQPPSLIGAFAAGSRDGNVLLSTFCFGVCPALPGPGGGWLKRVRNGAGFEPEFLWIPFGGSGTAAAPPCASTYSLVVRDTDRLYAFCENGDPLPGWGRAFPDSLAPGLGAGDPDGDGYPEVLVQTVRSGVAFVNATGGPSPGWPKRPTDEDLPSAAPALAADVDGDGRSEVVTMNASGTISALTATGREAPGWPLASGAGAAGGPVLADLDGDGALELIAPDHVDRLWAYSIGAPARSGPSVAWPMLGGDPGRTCALPAARTSVARAASSGPLVKGTLVAYPNPARFKPVTFAYQLTEPARVDFRVLDTSGHEVASFARDGVQADNLVTWDPGALPAGLYLVQVRVHSQGHEYHQTLQVGLLR